MGSNLRSFSLLFLFLNKFLLDKDIEFLKKFLLGNNNQKDKLLLLQIQLVSNSLLDKSCKLLHLYLLFLDYMYQQGIELVMK